MMYARKTRKPWSVMHGSPKDAECNETLWHAEKYEI